MKIIAGVDEVGRGSLIGPVYAAAVILNKKTKKKIMRDSKLLSQSQREFLARYIKRNSTWAIGKASVKEIEKMNILNASLLAMKRAIKKLKKKPQLVLIDGNKLPEMSNYKLRSIIKVTKKFHVFLPRLLLLKSREIKWLLNLDKNLKFTIGKKIMVMEQNII